MDVVAVARHVGRLLDILAPVATLLAGIDGVDAHHPVLVAVRVNVVARNPHLAAVLDASDKVLDVLLLLLDSLLYLQRVADVLFLTDVVPEILVHLHLVLHAGVILQLRLFADAYQALDVEPVAPEDRRVVRHGIILQPRRRIPHQDGELALLGALKAFAVCTRGAPHQHLQVAQRVLLVQQHDALDVRLLCRALAPVGIEDVVDAPMLVGLLHAAVARLLVSHLHDA